MCLHLTHRYNDCHHHVLRLIGQTRATIIGRSWVPRYSRQSASLVIVVTLVSLVAVVSLDSRIIPVSLVFTDILLQKKNIHIYLITLTVASYYCHHTLYIKHYRITLTVKSCYCHHTLLNKTQPNHTNCRIILLSSHALHKTLQNRTLSHHTTVITLFTCKMKLL